LGMLSRKINKHDQIQFHDYLILIPLYIFSAWTVAYHFVLYARLPAGWLYFVFLGALFVFGMLVKIYINLSGKFFIVQMFLNIKSHWFLLLLSIFTALVSLVNLRPDNDDVEFFHRAYYQLLHLEQPIATHETTMGRNDLFQLSWLHLATSYEFFISFMSHLVGLNPVLTYQNGAGFVFSAAVPMLYYVIFRSFGISKLYSYACVIGVIVFFFLDGNLHRSFGNVAFVRLWQGKTIVWTILIPLTQLVTWKFLREKSTFGFILLIFIGITGVGFSNTSIYIFPVLVLCVILAFNLNFIVNNEIHEIKRNFKASLLAAAGIAYIHIFILGLLFHLIPTPRDNSSWIVGWPGNWWDNLKLVLGDNTSIIKMVLICFLVPIIVLPVRKATMLILYSVSLIILCFNSLLGRFWMEQVLPGSYWRFVYLLPLPLCSGFIFFGFTKLLVQFRKNRRMVILPLVALIMVSAITIASFKQTSVKFSSTYHKDPFEYNFDPNILHFSKAVQSKLDHKLVLAPVDVVCVIELLNPTIKMEATRSTLHFFVEENLPEEGKKRVNAQKLIEQGIRNDEAEQDLNQTLKDGVQYIIVSKVNTPIIQTILNEQHFDWALLNADENFSLLEIKHT